MKSILEKFYKKYNIKEDKSECAYFTGSVGYPIITDTMYGKLLDIILEKQANFTFYYGNCFSKQKQILNELIRENYDRHKVLDVLGLILEN